MHSPHQKTLKNSPSSAAQQRSRKDTSAVTHPFQDNRASSVAQRHLQESMQSHTPNTIQLREENNTQRQTNRTGLPDQLKSGVENLSGVAMDDVKVHYNSSKPAQLQAHAYAQGTDIHLAPGQEKHLPHEAWHVVQQKQGRVKPTKQLKAGVQLNDEARLEREADVMGSKTRDKHPAQFTSLKNPRIQNSRTFQLRSKNPFNPNTGITSHHIIPHELLEKILKKLDDNDKEEVLSASLPDFDNLTMNLLIAQGSIAVKYNNKSIDKVTDDELDKTLAAKKFGELSTEEKRLLNFVIETEDVSVSLNFDQFKVKYEKSRKGETVTHHLGGDQGAPGKEVKILGFDGMKKSFFEWQGGNLFYGPDRIEPGKKDEFDFDAKHIYGDPKTNRLETVYNNLRKLQPKSDDVSKGHMKTELLSMLEITRNGAVPSLDMSSWYMINSDLKLRVFNSLFPQRHHTSKEGASIHKLELKTAIDQYVKNNAHGILTFMGRRKNLAAGNCPDLLFQAQKEDLFLRENPEYKEIIRSTPPRTMDDIKSAMTACFKKVFTGLF